MPEDEVDVWTASLDVGAGALEPALAPAERARAGRLAPGPLRRRYVARRALRRAILAGYAGCPPDRLEFARGPAGKPELRGAGGLRFSCSASGGLALIAVARGRRVAPTSSACARSPTRLPSRRRSSRRRSTTGCAGCPRSSVTPPSCAAGRARRRV